MTAIVQITDQKVTDRHRFSLAQYFICLKGIVWREALRFIHQRERFISALVRPLVWLFIFAAGFRQVLGVSIIPPYETYVLYEVYIAPGLIAMIQLFNGMQSSLTMVYDRETGGMRTLLVSPFPRWWLLTSKLLAGTLVSVLQAYAFLLIAWFWEIEPPHLGYLALLPALLLSGFMLGLLKTPAGNTKPALPPTRNSLIIISINRTSLLILRGSLLAFRPSVKSPRITASFSLPANGGFE